VRRAHGFCRSDDADKVLCKRKSYWAQAPDVMLRTESGAYFQWVARLSKYFRTVSSTLVTRAVVTERVVG